LLRHGLFAEVSPQFIDLQRFAPEVWQLTFRIVRFPKQASTTTPGKLRMGQVFGDQID
jgi:hypothetical protein